MGRETLYRCDVCGQITRPTDCGRERILVSTIEPHAVEQPAEDGPRELRWLMAVVDQAAADAHRRFLAADQELEPTHRVDRIVCRACWPTRPAIIVQVGPQGLGGAAATQEVSP
jgi:hypothetical protein